MTDLITDEARAMVGAELDRAVGVVDRRDFQRWAAAVGDRNPLYFDGGFAREHGYRDVVMPPMYLTQVTAGVVDLDGLRPDGIPDSPGSGRVSLPGCPRRMAGGETTRFFASLHPGDAITSIRRLGAIDQKAGRSGPFVLLQYVTTFTRDEGELVAESTMTVIARPPAALE